MKLKPLEGWRVWDLMGAAVWSDGPPHSPAETTVSTPVPLMKALLMVWVRTSDQ